MLSFHALTVRSPPGTTVEAEACLHGSVVALQRAVNRWKKKRSLWSGGEITAHGLRHSAATILLNHLGKDLLEIQELLRHKNIRTTVRYTPGRL